MDYKQDNVVICRLYMLQGATTAHLMVTGIGFCFGQEILHLEPSLNVLLLIRNGYTVRAKTDLQQARSTVGQIDCSYGLADPVGSR
jgi:hypothetical protein